MSGSEPNYVVMMFAVLSGLAIMGFAYYQTTLDHWIIAGFSGAFLMGILIIIVNLLQEWV